MSDEIEDQQLYPCKVKLEKNTKGYNFTLSMMGPDFATIIKEIEIANIAMVTKFGGA